MHAWALSAKWPVNDRADRRIDNARSRQRFGPHPELRPQLLKARCSASSRPLSSADSATTTVPPERPLSNASRNAVAVTSPIATSLQPAGTNGLSDATAEGAAKTTASAAFSAAISVSVSERASVEYASQRSTAQAVGLWMQPRVPSPAIRRWPEVRPNRRPASLAGERQR